MKFQANTRRQAIDYEKDLIKHWQKHKTFEKSVDFRPADNAYVFYDGPPFITGVPHHGTLLSSISKDAVPRYWTMKGKRVERVWGWDCHGLPAEVFTEKKLGIEDKRDIGTKISLEQYILTCRDNMIQTGNLWEDTIARVGRWVDFRGAYKTMDKDYMESVWWAFKQLYDKGKIYEGEKVLMYCVRDATPISKAEVAMDNSYQIDTDPSVYVKFRLTDESLAKLKRDQPRLAHLKGPVYLLAWTTTPWTLNSNTAIAVNQDLTYCAVRTATGETLVVAENLIDDIFTDEKHQPLDKEILAAVEGRHLVGLSYEPLFGDRRPQMTNWPDNAYRIWHAEFVNDQDGTGIAHESPAYGEEDYLLAKANDVPLVLDTDDEGDYTDGEWQGRKIWDVNKEIAKTLHERGIVWKIDYIQHEYPHCHRCGTKLMYRAHPSWFMDIDGQRTAMLEQNGNINWFPGHIKNGRFAKTVESAPDWNLSRDRFWATAMPVWKATGQDGEELIKVVGSYDELEQLSGRRLDDYHRPWIDDVTFTIDGAKYQRIDKVLDCWFESGSMPFAQFHYPFENADKFEQNFPGDYIAEYVGQVRAWFYYLHAVSVGLFGSNSFKNVVVTGTLAGNDGRKMSKNFGNYTDPNELMDQFSADALRLLLLGSPVLNGEDFALMDKDVADINRKLAMIWNMYDFFTLYASVDGWEWDGRLVDPMDSCRNPLDAWIISRVHQLVTEVDQHMQNYDLPSAIKPILPFVDDASNWYVRRSRKRFWKTANDTDKDQAYRTLHYVLVRLAEVMAPFAPFLAEELFLKLTGGELGESVHLRDWPEVGHVNDLLVANMTQTRDIITGALALRAQAGIKVRQPLSSLTVTLPSGGLDADLLEIIKEEVNVKKVALATDNNLTAADLQLDTEITPELRREGLIRELIRQIQEARKAAGLSVDDRIQLNLQTNDAELRQAINDHRDTVMAETLATNLTEDDDIQSLTAEIDGVTINIDIKKS